MLAIVLAVVSDLPVTITLAAYVLVFFWAGASTSADVIADLGYLMEISPDDRRPEYSGYMNALVAPSRLLPFAGGLLLSVVSFHLLFGIAAAAVLARLAAIARLDRPRPIAVDLAPAGEEPR